MSSSEGLPKPLGVGTTSLPKTPFSYRWLLHDAKEILENKEGLQSHTFYVRSLLSLKTGNLNHRQVTLPWHLSVQKRSISLWQGKSPMYPDEPDSDYDDIGSHVWISECTFSILNSDNMEVEDTAVCKANSKIYPDRQGTCAVTRHLSNYERYLNDNKITIQVDTSVVSLCFSEINETNCSEDQKILSDVQPLHSGLKSLLDEELFVDVTIKCREKEFKVHKAVLIVESPVFKTMFETDMKEKHSSTIEITDADPEVISEVLDFLYMGSASNMGRMTEELLAFAHKYQIRPLLSLCETKLLSSVTVTNVVDLLIFADLYTAQRLKDACLKYIYRNSTEVWRTSQWKQRLKLEFPSLFIEAVEYEYAQESIM